MRHLRSRLPRVLRVGLFLPGSLRRRFRLNLAGIEDSSFQNGSRLFKSCPRGENAHSFVETRTDGLATCASALSMSTHAGTRGRGFPFFEPLANREIPPFGMFLDSSAFRARRPTPLSLRGHEEIGEEKLRLRTLHNRWMFRN